MGTVSTRPTYLTQIFIAQEQAGETTTPPSHPLPEEFSEVPMAFLYLILQVSHPTISVLCSTLNLCASRLLDHLLMLEKHTLLVDCSVFHISGHNFVHEATSQERLEIPHSLCKV